MKKLICLLSVVFIFLFTVSATDHLQVEVETPMERGLGFPAFGFSISHEHFFDKIGVKEEISFSPIVFGADNIWSAYVGPAFRIPVSSEGGVDFITSVGLKLGYSGTNKTVDYNSKITLNDDYSYFGYALAGNSQFKFMADKRASIIVGSQYGIGNVVEFWKQSVVSKDPNDHYKTLAPSIRISSAWIILKTYLGCSFNF